MHQNFPVDPLYRERLTHTQLAASNHPGQKAPAAGDLVSQSRPDFLQVAAGLTFHSNFEPGFASNNRISRFQIA